MKHYIFSVIVSLIISTTLTPLLKTLAFKHNIMIDLPNKRKNHTEATPRNGGIGIALAFLVSLFIAIYIGGYIEQFSLFSGVFAGGIIILILGILDDIKGLKAYEKLLGQTFASIVLILSGTYIESVFIPFWHVFNLPFPLAIIITVLWILTFINAFNFIDGIDGLAIGTALIASVFLFLISLNLRKPEIAILVAPLIGSCAGFLRYNYYPASIFMGDSGSMFLGYILSVVSIRHFNSGDIEASVLIPLTILGIPLVDITFAIIRRLIKFQSPFHPDKSHIHHLLLKLGLGQGGACLIIYSVCGFLGIISILSVLMNNWISMVIIVFAWLLLINSSILLYIKVVKTPTSAVKSNMKTD